MRRLRISLAGALAAGLAVGITGTAASKPQTHLRPRLEAAESTQVLTFGELPLQPADGLTYNGVTFRFTIFDVHNPFALYGGPDGGIERYVQDPALVGNSFGVLTLTFAKPTHIVQFGVARSIVGAMNPGCIVRLINSSGGLIGTFTVDTQVYVLFSEGLFQYSGAVPVSRALLTFPQAASVPTFAIDNLTYRG